MADDHDLSSDNLQSPTREDDSEANTDDILFEQLLTEEDEEELEDEDDNEDEDETEDDEMGENKSQSTSAHH